MEHLASSKHGIKTLSSYYSMVVSSGTDFPLKPVFLRGFSGSLHLVLLFLLLISWVCKKFRVGVGQSTKQRTKSNKFLFSEQTFICSLGVLVFNLALCLLYYFNWYRNGWSEERLVNLLDLALRTLAWIALSVYLFSHFSELEFPYLRVWWGFYFSISCCCLVIDIILQKKHFSLPIHSLVSHVVSVVTSLFFIYVGIIGNKEGEDSLLEEPLLNGSSSVCNNATSNVCKGDETVTPYSNAGTLSILTFSWIGPLISLGNKKILDFQDLPQLDPADSVPAALPTFRNKLESECGTMNRVTTIKLAKALLFSSWKEILFTGFLTLVYSLASYVGPYFIDTFVQYLNGRREFQNKGYILVSSFFIAKIVECLSRSQWYLRMPLIGIKMRAVLVAMIYNKGLTLSCQFKHGHSSGAIINFMAIDAERVGSFSWHLHYPWMVLVQVTLALMILYRNLGLAAIAGFVATVVIMLLNVPLGKLQEKLQNKLMKSKDRRMKSTSEILRNMRILKLQAWEMKFLSKIIELRKVETGWLKKFLYTNAITKFFFLGAPTFVSVVTYATCMLLGIPLESGKILSALATFKILEEPIYKLPEVISMVAQTKVSLDRIASFLCLDELQSDRIEKLPKGSSDTAIEIVDGTFSWDISSPTPTLRDINIQVSHGMKIAICGSVGSGKSSLLCCVLGEIPKRSGTIKLCGTKAYVAQSPWIQSGKIEENILFGKEMDRERYERVLEACSLKKDLEILSFGDQTIIGERGINLSGGQKQRIQIARALYHDADIYLFDDPFSAVDAHTGSHLFKVMKDGRITQSGKYNEILNSGTEFMELVGAYKEALSTIKNVGALTVENISTSEDESLATKDEVVVNEGKNEQKCKTDIVGPKGQLVQEEEREKGRVGISVYWKYITTAYGGMLVPFILLAQILFEILQIGSNYWMAWATPVSKDTKAAVGGSTLLFVYVALAIASSFCVLVRASLLATTCYKTATLLFNKMHICLFRAPMSFFDATPSGRILTRVSTDQSVVDLNITSRIGSFAFCFIQLLGVIAVMCHVAWQVFVIFIPVVAISIWYQQYYIPSARELARLRGVCKAPVIQHFAETISGSTTIRSFDQVTRFQETNMKLSDGYSQLKFYVEGAMRWLGFRLDMLASIIFAFSLVFLISIPEGSIDPGTAGLAVTYGLNLNSLQAIFIWTLCNMENRMISAERILQYTSLQSEPPLVIESNQPDHSWPFHGEVEILDLEVRYAPHLPLILRGLSCTFPGGKKTGIAGRTGSGKSTLIQTLFRIVEPAAGQIMIDGINISLMGLHDLRSRLSIIPQDPTMFEGTIRSNLDPLEEYTDEHIWAALDKCQIGDKVRKKEGMLDSTVTENGDNWSMGQRQLVCLGRVLLKKSKVLVLDEATASVDTATDNLIQQTIRQHFSDCTVITIAHRITSILDSDMVLLLSHGLIEEYDSPATLLDNKSSSFAQLVAEYGTRSNSKFE
ncbi:ABC transporter C family member 3-like isoform X2 [Ziziphus jujuba]|uniref:ABC-type xenobiotic transporter n=1 Tax=Ziziphus jujuba TaxID=326968 RepID=A0ABM4A5S5_ZIZJJ|nr:ABC transporter C family member 3-like isoform X2 [Ziziphus jujuba]